MIFNANRIALAIGSVAGLAILVLDSSTFANEVPRCIEAASGPAFFVSSFGNDAWSGLLAEPNADGTDGPFATLERARDAMRADPDIATTYVRDGTYYLSSTLDLTSADTGVTFAAYPGETPILSGGPAGLGTIIKLDNADGVTILGLTFMDAINPSTHLDGFALEMYHVDNATIAYNTFENVGTAILMVRSSNNAILGNEMRHLGFQGVTMFNAEGNSIVGNYIHHIGEVFNFAAAGVEGYDVKDNIIAYNDIEYSSRWGISIKDGGSHVNIGNVIEYNQILHTNTEQVDTGAIAMLGRSGIDTNTIIRYNYIEDTGNTQASGIYLDDLTSGVEIYGNFIKNTALTSIHIHGGRNIIITNNVAILQDISTIISGHEYFVWEQRTPSQPFEMSYIEWSTNVIYAPDGLTPDSDYWLRGSGTDLGSPTVSNNLLYNVDMYDGPATGTPDDGSIIADPLFTDPDNGDYTLLPESPAYALGFTDLPYVLMGKDGFDLLDDSPAYTLDSVDLDFTAIGTNAISSKCVD